MWVWVDVDVDVDVSFFEQSSRGMVVASSSIAPHSPLLVSLLLKMDAWIEREREIHAYIGACA